jgi:Tol biopolymer transport system component
MLGVTKAMGAVLVAVIFCSLTTTAGQPTANPAGDDLGPFGHGLGQTISADGRYTTLTSGSGVQLIDLRTGKKTLLRSENSASERVRVHPYTSAISPDGSQVAFYQTTGTQSELRMIGRTGQGERVLMTAGSGERLVPADWSPDGRFLLVASENALGTEMRVVAMDRSSRILVTRQPQVLVRARFSPDGAVVAYAVATGDAARPRRAVKLFYVQQKGGAPISIEVDGSATDFLGWLPHGRTIVFTRDTGGSTAVGTYDLDQRGAGPILPSIPTAYDQVLGLTSDGYFLYTDTRRTVGIYELDLKSGQAESIRDGDDRLVAPAWSPNGQLLFYMVLPSEARGSERGSERHVFIRNHATGQERRVVVTNRQIVRNPSWTRDGDWILLPILDRQPHIERMNVNTSATEAVSGTEAAEGHDRIGWPRLSPDSRHLYFVEGLNSSGDWDLIELDLQTKMRRQLAVVDQRFDVSPDGKSFAVAVRNGVQIIDESGPRQIVTIETGDRISSVAWSADGRNLYYARLKSADIFQIAANGGAAKSIYTGLNILPDFAVHPFGRSIAFNVEAHSGHLWRWRMFEPRRPR